jgi:predicted nucleotidyltransferase
MAGNANLELDRDALAAFCRKWKIRELSIFGSALRDDFGPESDLDFLVSFESDAPVDIDALLDMQEELEARYDRSVDVVEKEALRNPWRKYEILKTREVIYAA